MIKIYLVDKKNIVRDIYMNFVKIKCCYFVM